MLTHNCLMKQYIATCPLHVHVQCMYKVHVHVVHAFPRIYTHLNIRASSHHNQTMHTCREGYQLYMSHCT